MKVFYCLLLFRWAAIAITTLLIRTATVPILINQLKAMSKLAVSFVVVAV